MDAMRAAGVARIVFSSTCATYGEPDAVPITEAEPQQPINPYGFTKLVIERALADYAQAYGWGYAALRYFNAAGARRRRPLGEDHDPETHLIPLVLQVALGRRDTIPIFGDQHPTPGRHLHSRLYPRRRPGDGPPGRPGAVRPGRRVEAQPGHRTGHERPRGHRRLPPSDRPPDPDARSSTPRAGDPPELVADSSLARKTLGWEPRYTEIEPIIETAWRWHRDHPRGYAD